MNTSQIESKLNPQYLAGIEFESPEVEQEFMEQAMDIIMIWTVTELMKEFKDHEIAKVRTQSDLMQAIKRLKNSDRGWQILDDMIEEYKRTMTQLQSAR
jgi:hypothetical protein